MGEQLNIEELVKALQHCDCGGVMVYDGHPSTTNPARQKLHVMYCRQPDCQRRWDRRFFDDNGDEQRKPKFGEHCLDRRKRELPPKAKDCPVCGTELRYPKKISEIGGVHYVPPLLRVVCLNPDEKDHSPRIREQLRLPPGSRDGFTFYYDQKHSKFVQIHLKALKKGHPEVKCRAHGRMRVTTITETGIARVPRDVLKKFGSIFPVYRAQCRFGDRGFWISADSKIKIPVRSRSAQEFRARMPQDASRAGGE